MGSSWALGIVFLNIRLAPSRQSRQASSPIRPAPFHFFRKSRSITSGGYASRMLNNGTHENGHHDTLRQWSTAARWEGITRLYTPEDVARLSGSIHIEYTLARMGAERLWNLLRTEPYMPALGALTGNQAVQQVQAGLKAIYVSGWQVAGDANVSGQMCPDQSLYPVNSVPTLVRA